MWPRIVNNKKKRIPKTIKSCSKLFNNFSLNNKHGCGFDLSVVSDSEKDFVTVGLLLSHLNS